MGDIQLLRAVAALALLALLYRLLGEEGEGWGRSLPSITRRVAFALVGTGVFLALSPAWGAGGRRPGEGKAFEAYYAGSQFFRLEKTGVPAAFISGGDGLPADHVARLREAVRLQPQNPVYRRHLAAALADRGETQEALLQLKEAARLASTRDPVRGEAERRLWSALFASPPPDAAALGRAEGEIRRLGLGWLGRVLLAAAHVRARGKVPPALEADTVGEARRHAVNILVAGGAFLFLLPQLAVISLFVLVVLIQQKVIRRVRSALAPVGAPLWEGVILVLALGLAPGLLAFGPARRPGPDTPAWVLALLLLSGDLLQLLAVVYLYFRLRARGLGLAEIGLHRRHLSANVLLGVMAYTVLTPAAVLLGVATQFLSDRLFPNVAPPYHPLAGWTALGGGLEIRAALGLLSVVGAPLLEEIFFRGALYGAIRRRRGIAVGLAGSAVVFAMLHPQLPLGFLPIAILGAAYAGLYEWRQSLIPAMVAHALNNGTVFLILCLAFPLSG